MGHKVIHVSFKVDVLENDTDDFPTPTLPKVLYKRMVIGYKIPPDDFYKTLDYICDETLKVIRT